MMEHEWSAGDGAGEAPGLSGPDAAALDALVDHGWDSSRAARAAGGEPARISAMADLLGLLDSEHRAHSSLVDVTVARVLKARTAESRVTGGDAALSEDDEAALESWIMHGYDASRVAPSLRERARRLERLAALATAGGVPSDPSLADPTLVDRTVAHIAQFEEAASESMRLPAARRRGLAVRFADLVSVAAVVLIGAGVIFPVLTAVREQGRRTMCQSNLGSTALAMSTYAGANRDSMPITTAGLGGGGHWWDVGQPTHSNSANLYTLARDKYETLQTLACPGNPAAPTAPASPDARDWRRIDEVSYSYQIMMGPQRPAWNYGQRLVVLADRSPVVLRAVRGERIDPSANAPNHRGSGQQLLSNDGAVKWASSPVLPNGDNIWLPRSLEVRVRQSSAPLDPLSGRELPDGADDTCLGP